MRTTNQSADLPRSRRRPEWSVVGLLLLMCVPVLCTAQEAAQKVFSSPAAAADALVAALQSDDEKAMLDLLGPNGAKIISSGDPTEDAESRAIFLERYEEMHRLVNEPDGTVTLYIGAKNWPSPIPIVPSGQSWHFDTITGEREILYRRIGRNELSTIQVCQEFVTAENEYRATWHGKYVSKIFSDEGQHNGLYWAPIPGEAQSPLGPLVASAVVSSDIDRSKHPLIPYRGYYFQVMALEGKNSRGAKRYVANGKPGEGFALMAFPSEYRSSGVLTFSITSDGVLYEKDFGVNTSAIVRSLKRFEPDASWHRVETGEAMVRE